MRLRSRLRRHLSYANVVASIALFAALCGGAYAATTINGNKIVNQSIAGKKLKNGTITSKQIKSGTLTSKQIEKNSLDSSVIDVSTLVNVQSAQTATTAATATTATSADKATTAESATKATEAGTAEHATLADQAEEADRLNGVTAAELTVACPADTKLFAGMCWDESVRPVNGWIDASIACGDAGGRLPSLSELVAYIAQPGIQAAAENWSGDVGSINVGGEEVAFTSDETTRGSKASKSFELGYRCLFYRVN